MRALLLLNLIFAIYSCNSPKQNKDTIAYIELSEKLDEVSGLTFDSDKHLYAINDEEGIIFKLDLHSYEIIESIKFKNKGDFEGIVCVGNSFFVLKSDGKIFEVDKSGSMIRKSKVPKRFIKQEFEGIAFYEKDRSILLAQKRSSRKKENKRINIYAAQLDSLKLDTVPFMSIKKEDSLKGFTPSGMAIDKSYLYILSSKKAELIKVDLTTKELSDFYRFDKAQLPQLEGVAITDGTIYISSEKSISESSKIYCFLED